MTERSPDFVEPVVGYRAWRLADDGELVPWTVARAGGWKPGANTAVCHLSHFMVAMGEGSRRTPRHKPPSETCMCGLYALHDPRDPRIAPGHDTALGAIVAWGDLEVHATGYRAEHACIVALALPAHCAPSTRQRLERAAGRYRVPLVPQDRLAETAREHGAPLPAFEQLPRRRRRGVVLGERPPWAFPAPDLAPGGAVGYDFSGHVWAETAIDHAVVGITAPFAVLLGDDPDRVRVVVAEPGTALGAGDVLARITVDGSTFLVWSPFAGTVRETAAHAERLLGSPEGAGWIATVTPAAWDDDRDGLRWGPEARRAYHVDAARTQHGVDAFADVRAERITALPRVASWGDVLVELKAARARELPRFADTAALYDRLGVDLGCSLSEDPKVADRLGRLGVTLALELRDPAARLTLELDAGSPRLRLGATEATADLTLSCTAEDAHRLLRGDLDTAAALRCGDLRSTAPDGRTLALLSVLKGVAPGYARRAAPDPGPRELAARRLGVAAS